MTAKQYLKELKRLDACIAARLREKDALYAGAVGAVRTDMARVRSSAGEGPVPGLVERLEALEADIDRLVDRYVDRRHIIIGQIQALRNEAFSTLLFKRYVEYQRLEEIAVGMGYSYKYIRRLHGHALQEFSRLYETEIAAYEAALKIGGTK